MDFDPHDELEGGSALRLDEGQFFSALQDDYCIPVASHPPESDRLDYLHEIYKYSVGNVPDEVAVYLNEEPGGKRILDVGCGTARWALEMAEAYPHCHVTGVDLAHPPVTQFPANFDFRIHDVTKGQEYQDGTFDLVNIRDLHAGMPDYDYLLSESIRVVRPGGFLLVKEIEWELVVDDPEQDVNVLFPYTTQAIFREALFERQLDPWIGLNLFTHIHNVSSKNDRVQLEDIRYERIRIPMTPWPTDERQAYIGRASQAAFQILGSTIRIMLKDHGEPTPDKLFEASLEELNSPHGMGLVGKPLWSFASVVARKAGIWDL